MRPTPALVAGGRMVTSFLSATEWMLPSPATQVHTISVLPSRRDFAFSNLTMLLRNSGGNEGESGSTKFHVVRDDLLHPLANGNKARKLDALLPILRRCGVTDIVTCGGCQSAHAAAIAVHCAEWGIRPHILLRGEQLDVPTGYNLISLMFGNVTYVSRSLYAQRDEMLYEHAIKVAGYSGTVMWADEVIGKGLGVDEDTTDGNGSRRVMIVKEGAGSVQALLGVMRLLKYLSGLTLFRKDEKVHIVVDSGTGTTAVGLQWRVTAVMLADTLEGYKQRERSLLSDFEKVFPEIYHGMVEDATHDNLVQWVERFSPRRSQHIQNQTLILEDNIQDSTYPDYGFGKVLDGEIAMCRQVAQQTGILLDPMYTLAAWEQAVDICCGDSEAKVLMIHTGGTLGLFGLAQRYSSQFNTGEQP
ncbi:D-cysteine desulfhydrase 2 mitochondrial [Zea mays]|uniref:D-cysteine desulfhydrase n=1 Tax=Zea mays TaxID=4577 RepID=A0A1D6NER1_MAIZE|nr:D-cysteine desulfhydrase 2 mitochondrial [Zea mays]